MSHSLCFLSQTSFLLFHHSSPSSYFLFQHDMVTMCFMFDLAHNLKSLSSAGLMSNTFEIWSLALFCPPPNLVSLSAPHSAALTPFQLAAPVVRFPSDFAEIQFIRCLQILVSFMVLFFFNKPNMPPLLEDNGRDIADTVGSETTMPRWC